MKKSDLLNMEYDRFMRLLIFFDLPTLTKKNRRDYTKFRKNLIRNGFYMIQESVYAKMVIDHQLAESITNKINSFLPSEGNVMVLTITEKQFNGIEILLGDAKSDVVSSLDRILEI